jgi:hypothetical protein
MRRALTVCALAGALFAGCGEEEPTPEEQVRSTVTEFGRATEGKDYQALCDELLAPQLVEEVAKVGLPCEVALQRGLGDVRDPKLTIGAIRVDGKRATAEVRTSAAGQTPSRDVLQLVAVDDRWLISSLGG